MKYYIVDAFTDQLFGGNPAGMVLLGNGDFPDERLMLQVAAELRYSETAFVQQNGPTEFSVRYFTPAGEVDLCGHATIATFGVLCREGIVPDGAVCMNHTLAGDLEVTVGPLVMMQMAAPLAIDKLLDAIRLHDIMAGPSKPQWPDMPVEVISTGLPDIIVPVANVDALNALSPDMAALTGLSRDGPGLPPGRERYGLPRHFGGLFPRRDRDRQGEDSGRQPQRTLRLRRPDSCQRLRLPGQRRYSPLYQGLFGTFRDRRAHREELR